MSLSNEVSEFFVQRGVKDSLSVDEKRSIVERLTSSLPISLDPLSCFDEHVPRVDIDAWNRGGRTIRAAVEHLPEESLLLFVPAWPKSSLLRLERTQLFDLLLDPTFCFSFAVFSLNEMEFLLEDHTGLVVGSGRFEPLITCIQ